MDNAIRCSGRVNITSPKRNVYLSLIHGREGSMRVHGPAQSAAECPHLHQLHNVGTASRGRNVNPSIGFSRIERHKLDGDG
jgi:hypothetical protein